MAGIAITDQITGDLLPAAGRRQLVGNPFGGGLVSIPVLALSATHAFVQGTIPVLTWGGLRGGISVALVLSLPEVAEKSVILAAAYAVVLFSITVQGLTLKALVKRVVKRRPV